MKNALSKKFPYPFFLGKTPLICGWFRRWFVEDLISPWLSLVMMKRRKRPVTASAGQAFLWVRKGHGRLKPCSLSDEELQHMCICKMLEHLFFWKDVITMWDTLSNDEWYGDDCHLRFKRSAVGYLLLPLQLTIRKKDWHVDYLTLRDMLWACFCMLVLPGAVNIQKKWMFPVSLFFLVSVSDWISDVTNIDTYLTRFHFGITIHLSILLRW